MNFEETNIKGLFLIKPKILGDERGSFFRTYCEEEFSAVGFKDRWLQANQSITKKRGAIRGLHYQTPPGAEIKLIRCVNGIVFDVIVDLRKDSDTFLKYCTFELSEENSYSLFVPKGCAHGFQTLEENCKMVYFHSEMHSPKQEAGIRYNDPLVNIQWPLEVTEISDRDKNFMSLQDDFKGLEV